VAVSFDRNGCFGALPREFFWSEVLTGSTASPVNIMRKRMKALFLGCITLVVCGCTQVNYTAYVGQQQEWPFATGAIVQNRFALPVYQGPPDRPYRILGWVQVENARGALWRRSGGVEYAVKEAAKRGADAVILLRSRANTSETLAPLREGYARVVAIKFL
jgi:hypothetical protein